MIVCDKHIEIAAKVANSGDVIKARMSALAISRSGDIICSSSNRLLQGNRIRYSEHAEEATIRKLLKVHAFDRYKGISIFVFRISSLGVSMARPCLKCQKLLNRYPVTVFYTTENGKVEKLC
jgi:hypothetical protein